LHGVGAPANTPGRDRPPPPAQDQPILAVGLLDGRLRFFTSSGTQKHKDREMAGGLEGRWGEDSTGGGGKLWRD
jgi:hypothetical protein